MREKKELLNKKKYRHFVQNLRLIPKGNLKNFQVGFVGS